MTIEEAGSPNRREEGSNAGCLALQSGEEVTKTFIKNKDAQMSETFQMDYAIIDFRCSDKIVGGAFLL